MKERRYKVQPYKIWAICTCGGQMNYTGQELQVCPPLYTHQCEMCSKIENLKSHYPLMTHEIVTEENLFNRDFSEWVEEEIRKQHYGAEELLEKYNKENTD